MVLREKLTGLNPMLGMLVNGQVLDRVKEALVNEIDKLLPEIVDSALEEFRRRLDFKELAREKIETFSMDKLEQVLTSILHKEFKFIELVGAVLGLAIGVFQAALFYLY
jgi:uncharacterized membrane protein YheB (UPF0754 family)